MSISKLYDKEMNKNKFVSEIIFAYKGKLFLNGKDPNSNIKTYKVIGS